MNRSETPLLLVGMGNPILGDDGVGWVVADRVGQFFGLPDPGEGRYAPSRTEAQGRGIEIDRLSLGGLSLMERLIGYDRVILIDAITTGNAPPGTVWKCTAAGLEDPSGSHTTAPHDTNLVTALKVGRSLGVPLPQLENIQIVAVEIEHRLDFSEDLSPPVFAAVPVAVDTVLEMVRRFEGLAEGVRS